MNPVFRYPDGHVVPDNDPMWRGQPPNSGALQVKNKWMQTTNKGVLTTLSDNAETLLVVCETTDDSCIVAGENRISCGSHDEAQCRSRGCCYDSVSTVCYLNSKSSPFYSLRRKWSHDTHYVTKDENTFYKKPKMPCEVCPADLGWKGYHINGETICHTKPTDHGLTLTLPHISTNDERVTIYKNFPLLLIC